MALMPCLIRAPHVIRVCLENSTSPFPNPACNANTRAVFSLDRVARSGQKVSDFLSNLPAVGSVHRRNRVEGLSRSVSHPILRLSERPSVKILDQRGNLVACPQPDNRRSGSTSESVDLLSWLCSSLYASCMRL